MNAVYKTGGKYIAKATDAEGKTHTEIFLEESDAQAWLDDMLGADGHAEVRPKKKAKKKVE